MKTAASQPIQKRLRVLIADDSVAIRNSLSALLSRLPDVDVVGMAHTGTEALGLLRILKPDVATLDIRMPEMNGLEVLEAIRREELDVVAIIMKGLDELEYRRKYLDLGASHFFHKSTEFEKVIEVVKGQAALLAQAE